MMNLFRQKIIFFILINLFAINNTLAELKDKPEDSGLMILVEGLDLAGKSTLIKNLLEHLKTKKTKTHYSRNALVLDNPINEKAQILRREPNSGLLETGALFLSAHLYDAINFQYPKKDSVHIQDSSWLRTLAFHSINNTRWIPDLVKTVRVYQPKFDIVVYLTASISKRQERVKQREQENPKENDDADYMSFVDPEKVKEHDEILFEKTKEYYPHVYKIDTSSLTSEEVSKIAIDIISQTISTLTK